VLPLEEREHDNRGGDVRDDEDEFEERPEVDAVVGAGAGDVALGIIENRLEETQRRDRSNEGDEESAPKANEILLCALTWRPPSRRGKAAILNRGMGRAAS